MPGGAKIQIFDRCRGGGGGGGQINIQNSCESCPSAPSTSIPRSTLLGWFRCGLFITKLLPSSISFVFSALPFSLPLNHCIFCASMPVPSCSLSLARASSRRLLGSLSLTPHTLIFFSAILHNVDCALEDFFRNYRRCANSVWYVHLLLYMYRIFPCALIQIRSH